MCILKRFPTYLRRKSLGAIDVAWHARVGVRAGDGAAFAWVRMDGRFATEKGEMWGNSGNSFVGWMNYFDLNCDVWSCHAVGAAVCCRNTRAGLVQSWYQ